ncbi:unnamed protein product, partial [Oppiella nova]
TSTKVNDKTVFELSLSSETVAPFVVLDFKANSGIRAQFLENGFFIFSGKKTIKMQTESKITEKDIKDNLTIKTLTDATVPGSIYSDLRREQVLKQDLFFENNDVNYRWVAYDNWTYERTFNVDANIISKKYVNLLANGIDTVSSVYINDQLIGKTDNQFVRYVFDVKKVLKSGQNTIRLAFQSAPIYAKQQSDDFKKKYNYTVQPECNPDQYHGECHFNFIRKMASSFSWDWGPAFPTEGIWKPIGIEAFDKLVIRDITVETTPDQKNNSFWDLTVHIKMESAPNQEFEGIFDIKLDNNVIIKKDKLKFKTDEQGYAGVAFIILLRDIKITPWYPNGVADNTQKLYDLNVELSFADSKEVSTQTKKIGFRTIKLIQNPIKPEGLTFYFEVNSKPFFAKGSNWIPTNVLMEDITPEYLRHLLLSAKEANMNMMRVWGGGVYESDLFYQLADEYGIMIWQDFMFACALYPANKEFLDSVQKEVITQVRRLQHHPSIAIWAGNNENEQGLVGWWKPRLPQYDADYRTLYVHTIGKILDTEDGTRPYVSSSPSNGLESIKENYTAQNPEDSRYGDIHYYSDGSRLWDWTTFWSPKFASEYGFQSYPSMDSLSEAFSAKELVFPLTPTVQHHQHKWNEDETIVQQIRRNR